MSVETPIFPTAIKEKDKKRIMETCPADKKQTKSRQKKRQSLHGFIPRAKRLKIDDLTIQRQLKSNND